MNWLDEVLAPVLATIGQMPLAERVEAINALRERIHGISPFAHEPVDFVRWVPSDAVYANDYNPNSVAPPEMKLLAHSIEQDGYTQPIVGWPQEGRFEVIDGFHRHRVGKEDKGIRARVQGYLPIVAINAEREDKGDRIASTIRHNRARGKHRVEAMSDIVIELKRRNWSDEKIAKNLGMDADEILRLTQITGLADAFKDQAFSQAWEAGNDQGPGTEILSDVIEGYTPSDGDRLLHTWDKWECYKAGFYAERCPDGMTQEEGEESYREFLSDIGAFDVAADAITREWTHSCEHYLTNDRMNRIAWIGQAAMAYAMSVPSCCRGGYNRLTQAQKDAADEVALKYLNRWLQEHGREPVTKEQAGGRTDAELY
jgi:ParB-like chromosome segregation protein Spo0J